MAKKKLTKKNKTLLLTIGAVAVGAGFILAKAFKKKESNLAGVGALTRSSPYDDANAERFIKPTQLISTETFLEDEDY